MLRFVTGWRQFILTHRGRRAVRVIAVALALVAIYLVCGVIVPPFDKTSGGLVAADPTATPTATPTPCQPVPRPGPTEEPSPTATPTPLQTSGGENNTGESTPGESGSTCVMIACPVLEPGDCFCVTQVNTSVGRDMFGHIISYSARTCGHMDTCYRTRTVPRCASECSGSQSGTGNPDCVFAIW
jgi:hypothetical protein